MDDINDKVLHSFVGAVGEIIEHTSKLLESAENHFYVSPDEVNWGDVGVMNHMVEKLRELIEYTNNYCGSE